MIKGIKNYLLNKSWQTVFFEFSTYLFVGTLPLLLKVNTIALWGFITGSILLSYKNKDWNIALRNNKWTLWAVALLWGLYILGVFLSQDLSRVLKDIGRTLPLVLVPLFVLTRHKEDFNLFKIFTSLGIGLFLGMLICWYHILLSILSKEKPLEQAKYFFEWIYTDWNLVEPLNGHPSYFAQLIVLFLVTVIVNENFKSLRRNKIHFLFLLFPFFLFLIETSSRIAIISLVSILLIHSINKLRFKGVLLMMMFLFVIILFSVKFNYLGSKFTKIIDRNGEIKVERYHRWKEILKVFNQEDRWALGVGSGDARLLYRKAYENGNFQLAFENNYNAHNQYLEFLVSNGLFGLIVYLFILGLFAYQTKLNKEALSFFIIILLFSISESFFGRSQGVLIFSFFYSFLLLYYNSKTQNAR
ncbi:O-antigen ligase family protein [Arenibacter lacus]|uniref:O-antigen ligase family protein n=1 Tax=Arenibacter lacus TaxID=2608629 RepID=UPI00123E1C05|nr:O-antigen ligase family protein [Arenibacter lacus]